jgi:parallel beta-helix repeat protein
VTISYCSRVAGYFRGDGLIIRNSLISDTGTEGIYVIGSSDVLLEKNIIRRNNIEKLTGYYPAAVKIFNQTRRVICRDNLVIDQSDSNGIWYDVGNRDGVFVNNWIEGALVGFFFEISRGVTVAGNIFVRCGKGVWILNSADARVYNNTFVDAPASISRNERSKTGDHFGWHPSTGPDVDQREGHVFINNLLAASEAFRNPLLQFDQPKSLCSTLQRPQVKELDGNVYVRTIAAPLIAWSPATADNCVSNFGSLDEFHKQSPAFENRGQQIDRTLGSIFKGPDVGRYELRQALPGTRTNLPADIRKILDWSDQDSQSPGAFPFRP